MTLTFHKQTVASFAVYFSTNPAINMVIPHLLVGPPLPLAITPPPPFTSYDKRRKIDAFVSLGQGCRDEMHQNKERHRLPCIVKYVPSPLWATPVKTY
jgi:hypothetical protein